MTKLRKEVLQWVVRTTGRRRLRIKLNSMMIRILKLIQKLFRIQELPKT